MKLALVITLATIALALGVWLLLQHETAAALPILLTIPLVALRIARGGSCGLSCRRGRRCADGDVFVG